MEGRQGQRTDLQLPQNFGEVKKEEKDVQPAVVKKELVPNLAQVQPGIKTRDIAAEAVGMNRETPRNSPGLLRRYYVPTFLPRG